MAKRKKNFNKARGIVNIRILTFTLLTWTIWRAPTNASKWRMGFNSTFKELNGESIKWQCIQRVELHLNKVKRN
jgi:hypothetical protein